MPRSLIVIPTYNEKDNIVKLMDRISRGIDRPHILIVDDDSPDGTARRVMEYREGIDFQVDLLIRKGERGLGGAYKAGFRYGLKNGYDIIVTMDADLSHDPKYLIPLLQEAKKFDLVIGSRYVKNGGVANWPLKRIFLSRFANVAARAMLGVKSHDMTSGYRAYKNCLLQRLNLDDIRSNGYSFLVEMYYTALKINAEIREIPIVFTDRRKGKSKISQKEIFLAIWTLIRLRRLIRK